MSDPIGSNAPQGKAKDELSLIYEGGTNFMARMEVLDKQRRAHDEAYLKLKIGGDAKAAYEEATKRLSEATAEKEAAAKALEKANKEAIAILAKANAEADAIRKGANVEAQGMLVAAGQSRTGADKYAADAKAKADAMVSDAKMKKEALDASLREVQKRAADHDAAVKAADVARKGAEDTKTKLQTKIDRLHEVIREIAGG